MSRWIALRSIVYDTQTLQAGRAEVSGFFSRRLPRFSESIATLTETEILRYLFDWSWSRALILAELGLTDRTKHALSVGAPFAIRNLKPGDVDAVLCDLQQPAQSVALECKRVRVVSSESGSNRVNRLENFGRAHDQANALAKLRFHRTFLTCIALADARLEPVPNFAVRGVSSATFQRLFDTAMSMPLEPEVGVLYIEFSQPVEASIDTAGCLSVGTLRLPRSQDQGEYLTSRVVNFMTEHGKGPTKP